MIPKSAASEETTDRQEYSSTITEPGTPVHEVPTGSTIIGSDHDVQAVLLPGTAVPGMQTDLLGSIVTADLGEMIDAIIIEHRGSLNKVITNLRNGPPNRNDMHRISKNLKDVSGTIDEIKLTGADAPEATDKGGYSVILDTPFISPEVKDINSPLDLLDCVDLAAKELGVQLAPFLTEETDDSLQGRTLYEDVTLSLEEKAMILKNRAANKSITPVVPRDSNQDHGEKLTGDHGGSPLFLAVNVPEAMPHAIPVVTLDPYDNDSDVARALVDKRSEGVSLDSSVRHCKGKQSEAVRPDFSAQDTSQASRTDGTSEVEYYSRIVTPHKAVFSGISTRKHSTDPAKTTRIPSAVSASGSVSSRRLDPFRALSKVEMTELREESRQALDLKSLQKPTVRDISMKERMGRRSRLGSTSGPVKKQLT